MSRQIRTHVIVSEADIPANDYVVVEAFDEPGPGGANHLYVLSWPEAVGPVSVTVPFQKGPVKEVGVNGVTNEALLAVVIDRLRTFQNGGFASRENALALTNIEQGLLWLHQRTRDRIARGVEGVSKP